MDNLRKRDYANFNNGNRNNRRYSSHDSFGDNRSDYNRNRYSSRDQRGNNLNRSNSNRNKDSMNRNVQVQYSNRSRGNSNNRLANVYDSISNTVQKKFNNVLYKGSKNNERDRKENNPMRLEEESQMNVPKSVFIFITIAVIFATGLVFLLTQPTDSSKSLIANNDKKEKEIVNQNNDDGFQTYADMSEEELQEKLDALEEGINNQEDSNTTNTDNGTNNSKNKNAVSVKKPESNTNNSSNSTVSSNTTTGTSNNTQYSTSDKNSTTNTNVPRPTIRPEDDEEEDDEELAVNSSDEGTFTLPCSIPAQGGLYRCVYSYASVGSDGRFVKYTNYVNEPYGISIPRKDLNGMWLVSKGLALSESSVSSVCAYRNGNKVDVCKITIYVNGTTKTRYIYAMKDTVVPFTDGNYKVKGTSSYITSLTVTKDVSVVEY